jgi:hypothetical protein
MFLFHSYNKKLEKSQQKVNFWKKTQKSFSLHISIYIIIMFIFLAVFTFFLLIVFSFLFILIHFWFVSSNPRTLHSITKSKSNPIQFKSIFHHKIISSFMTKKYFISHLMLNPFYPFFLFCPFFIMNKNHQK